MWALPIVEPSGGEPLQADRGGDARGAYAVDLQHHRLAASQVAAGESSVICGGYSNEVYSAYSAVGGGEGNLVAGSHAAIAGGNGNKIQVDAAHAYDAANSFIGGGLNNRIGADDGTIACVNSVICGGSANTVLHNRAFIGGGWANQTRGFYSSICGGAGNVTDAIASIVGGGRSNTCIGGQSTIAGGYYNMIRNQEELTTFANYGFIGGGRGNRIGSDSAAVNYEYSTVGGGHGNRVEATNGSIGGGYSNAVLANASAIAGGNTNTVEAGANFSAVAGGQGNTVSSSTHQAIGGGYQNAAAGQYSTIAGGTGNATSGTASAVPGGANNEAAGTYALASGYRAKAPLYAQHAQAAGRFAAAGDAQTSVLVARRITTNATPLELFLDGSAQRLTLADQDCWAFSILLVARRTDADGEGAGYRLEGVIHRNGSSTALVGNVSKTVLGESSAGWDAEVEADDTNESLKITVTGEAGKTIRWAARIELAQVNG